LLLIFLYHTADMWSERLQSSIIVCPINLAMCILTFQFEPLLYGRYCLRWGRPPSSDRRGKLRGCTWKKLYFEVVLHQCLFCILTRLYSIRRTFVICQVLPPVGLIAFNQWTWQSTVQNIWELICLVME
jgi:hypothetical protein